MLASRRQMSTVLMVAIKMWPLMVFGLSACLLAISAIVVTSTDCFSCCSCWNSKFKSLFLYALFLFLSHLSLCSNKHLFSSSLSFGPLSSAPEEFSGRCIYVNSSPVSLFPFSTFPHSHSLSLLTGRRSNAAHK